MGDAPIYDETAAWHDRIEAACRDWAAEVAALADLELQELTEGEK